MTLLSKNDSVTVTPTVVKYTGFTARPRLGCSRVCWHSISTLYLNKNLSEGNVSNQGELTTAAGGIARRRKQEAQMIKLMLRFVTLTTFLMALIGGPSFTPAFAMDGGGGGGGGGGDPASSSAIYPAPPHPPSSYPGRGTKATHKVKKTTKRSSIRRPGI
jgi:hypothetical protein